jgi:hypothetical protein
LEQTEMVLDTRIENALMFKPMGTEFKPPMYIRRGKDVYFLISKDPDGRACYKLR